MKKFIFIISAIVLSSVAHSQNYWSLTYDISVPFGKTDDLAGKVSWRGFGIDGRGFINDNMTVGGSWSWNVFYEMEKDQYYTSGTKTIHGTKFGYVNAMPFMVTSHYYFGEDGGARPYLGTGAGTIWKEDRLEVGTYSLTDNSWQFGVTPEIGIYLPVGTTAFIFLNAKYTYGVKTSNLTATSYLNFGIGIGWESF
jgi:outer membrane protein W